MTPQGTIAPARPYPFYQLHVRCAHFSAREQRPAGRRGCQAFSYLVRRLYYLLRVGDALRAGKAGVSALGERVWTYHLIVQELLGITQLHCKAGAQEKFTVSAKVSCMVEAT